MDDSQVQSYNIGVTQLYQKEMECAIPPYTTKKNT